MLKCILSTIIQFFTYVVEKIIRLVTMFVEMLCTLYNERRASAQQNNDLNTSSIVQQTQHEAQNMLNTSNENEIEQAPFSPISMDTTVSLTAPVSPAGVQNESTARKALRFMALPVASIKLSADRQSPAPPISFQPTAPSPSPIYRDLPGTPRRLF